MRTRLTHLLTLLVVPALAAGQDAPADPPLPPGAVKRLTDTRLRPGARITYLAFSPDGSRVVSVGSWMYFESLLSVWDTATGREVFTRSLPEHSVGQVGWGPDGGFVVRAGDGKPRLWAFADAAGKHPPPDPKAARVVPAGPKVVAVPVGAAPEPGPGVTSLSPDGTRLAVVPAGGGEVKLYATRAGATIDDLKLVATSPPTPAGACAGLHFARGNKAVVVRTTTGTGQSAVVWDVDNATVSEPANVPAAVPQGHTADVADDGSALAVGLADWTVKVFELPSGKEQLSVKKHGGPPVGGRLSELSTVKFVNGGKQILSAARDNRQLVWDAKTGADVAALNGHHSWVEAVAVSADGKKVATAGQDSLVRLWDATTWKPIVPPTGPHETVWRVEGSRDGKYAAAESGSGIYVWDVASGKEVRAIRNGPVRRKAEHVLFTPEGQFLADDGKGAFAVYPLPAGDPKPVPIKGRLLDFAPDGKTLLTTDGTAVHVWDWPAGTRRREVPVKAEVTSAVVSPDGRVAVVGASRQTGAVVIDLGTGAVSDLGLKLHWFAHAAGFAPGGTVVCGTPGSTQAEAWGLSTRGRLRQFELPPASGPGHFYQLSFAVSPDGRKAVSCQSDGGVAVYETVTGKLLAHFHGHRESVISVAWGGPDRVLSGGADHQVYVWDASLKALAGKVEPLPATDRAAAWDRLGTVPAKEAWKLMAALAADPDGAVELIGGKLKPVPSADPATLDRIFKDLDAPAFATREKAARELAGLGPGAAAGVRERLARTVSAEVRGRAEAFLRTVAGEDFSPDRVRFLRALEVLAAVGTPAARKVVEGLAGGAAEVWETEAARQGR